jgi:hypothetical protein
MQLFVALLAKQTELPVVLAGLQACIETREERTSLIYCEIEVPSDSRVAED